MEFPVERRSSAPAPHHIAVLVRNMCSQRQKVQTSHPTEFAIGMRTQGSCGDHETR